MASSLYDISVTSFLQMLDALDTVLDKGAAYCVENSIDADRLLTHRIAEDMLPLSFQLHMAAVHTAGSLEAIKAGEATPSGSIPELNYAGFREHLASTAAKLRELDPDAVNAMAERKLVFRVGDMALPFTAEGWVLSFSLPNLYFHATAAYAILRAAGVPLGKSDFLGNMRLAT